MPWENCEDNPEKFFNIKLLTCYDSSRVNEQEMTAIFARGQSLDRHENLQVFMQHFDKIYTWNACKSNDLTFVSSIDNQIKKTDPRSFYFLKSD